MYRRQESNPLVSCGCAVLLIAFNLWVGGWSVNYLLSYFIGKTIPTFGAMLIGLVAGEISVPTAIVVALLRFFGVL